MHSISMGSTVNDPNSVSSPADNRRLITKGEMLHRVGIPIAKLSAWIAEGRFPSSINFAGKECWLEHEIEEWVASQPSLTDRDVTTTQGSSAVDTTAQRIELARNALGFSVQADFAKSLGLYPAKYNSYINRQGIQLPVEVAILMCEKFGLTLDWIYRGDISGLPYRLVQKIEEEKQRKQGKTKRGRPRKGTT